MYKKGREMKGPRKKKEMKQFYKKKFFICLKRGFLLFLTFRSKRPLLVVVFPGILLNLLTPSKSFLSHKFLIICLRWGECRAV